MKKTQQESRRNFIKQSGLLAAGATLLAGSMVPKVHAAGDERKIKVVSIGNGGRGRGAMRQALEADPNTILWAVADTFEDKADGAVKAITSDFEKNKKDNLYQIDVTPERTFAGLDGYKKAMDTLEPGDVVLLTTPPAFRPLHFEYAVEKGLNIFAEKPVAVDIPGLKSLQKSNAKAKEKGLKVAVGLNNRHYLRTEETVKALQDGKLGDINAMFTYRMHPPHNLRPIGDMTPLQHQLRNIFCFDWTTGGFIVDAMIHNLDICCWAKQQLPIAAQGCGGRGNRKDKDQLIDHAAVEYIFPDGKRMIMQTKTIPNTWNCFQSIVHGSKGSAILGEGISDPMFVPDWNITKSSKDPFWKAEAEKNNSYQTEHDRFFKAIRDNKEWNEMDRGIDATFTPILGRMAVDTGQYVTAEQAWSSTFEYVPNIAELSFDNPGPILPDADGVYAMPIPGVTKYF